MSDFLSQDEVDSLLNGVTGEAKVEQETPEVQPGEVRPYNFASQDRVVRGRMPTLELINERFTRLFRIGVFNFVRRTPEIAIGPVRIVKYSEFIRNLPVPTNFNIVQVKPLRGNALFIFDPNLVFLMVDNMFGGDGRFHTRVEGREFTQTEQRIIQKLLAVLFEAYSKSWESTHPLKMELVRSEINPQFVNVATPNDIIITTTFDIDFGGNGGALHICLPYAMLEPIKDLLHTPKQGQSESLNVDHRWMQLLSRQVQSANIELVATLGQASVTLDQVLKMRSGDIIPLEVGESIIAAVNGIPLMECKYGSFNNQYALMVERMLANKEGEDHA